MSKRRSMKSEEVYDDEVEEAFNFNGDDLGMYNPK